MNDPAQTIRLAISTCPNDTFAFHAILNRKIDFRGLEFSIELLDIAELNRAMFENRFDVAKASFHAALKVANDYLVLPSGSALGFGNGPLLLAAAEDTVPNSNSQLTLCPGENTTAALLFRLFYGSTRVEHVVFSDIMPALSNGDSDFGVCIHEGRFTYRESGLHLVADLGQRWEAETSSPLPLGGILARKELGPEVLTLAQSVIQDSIRYGLANRAETLPTMQQYAQELDEDVVFQHVDLYVNDWTVDLGETGRQALKQMQELAKKQLDLPGQTKLDVLGQ